MNNDQEDGFDIVLALAIGAALVSVAGPQLLPHSVADSPKHLTANSQRIGDAFQSASVRARETFTYMGQSGVINSAGHRQRYLRHPSPE